MKNTDLHIRKLNIIEKLIILNDKKVISQMEDLINKNTNIHIFEPFTHNDLLERASKSEKDIENNDILSQDEIEKLSQNW